MRAIKAVCRVTDSLHISDAQNWRGMRASTFHRSGAVARLSDVNGACDVMKSVNNTTAIGAITTIFSAMVRFILSASAESVRANVMRSKAPPFRQSDGGTHPPTWGDGS